ncbi:MAG TPA: HPF/RaiA family ribosome-associated protein [Pseudorhodoplanes sp.]|jgi:cold shock CspA family protein|nr:HPF/RaiA family ribosome-associated protein [Pseudorhodoplanes sp.]
MQIPVDISFHNCEGSAAIEDAIRGHIARLEEIHPRLIACRVRVDQRADNSTHSIPPVVRIEISVPGRKDIVVAHEPERLQRRFQRPDMRNAVNEAFRIAARRLAELKQQVSDYKAAAGHEAANEFSGRIADLPHGEDYGFLQTKEGGQLYFHRNSVLSGDFDRLKLGDEVTYVEEMGDTGPIATKVRVKEPRA